MNLTFMRITNCVAMAVLVISAGCSTQKKLGQGKSTSSGHSFNDDQILAEALALYSQSLISSSFDTSGTQKESIEYLLQAIEKDPSEIRLYKKAAELYIHQKNFEGAQKLLYIAGKINPDDAEIHFQKATIYNRTKKYDKALAEYQKTARIRPAFTYAYVAQAKIYALKKREDKALKLFIEALPLVDNPSTILLICYKTGRKYLEKKEIDIAEQWFNVLTDYSNPKAKEFNELLAQLYENYGHKDKAEQQYLKCLNNYPKDSALYCNAARFYFDDKKDKKALQILGNGFERSDNPNIILSFCYNYGAQLFKDKEIDRATSCFKTIMKYKPEKAQQFHELLAELYEHEGDDDKAIEHLILATKTGSPNPSAFLKLASLYIKTGQKLALETLQTASSLLPNDGNIYFSLGVINNYEKQYTVAVENFRKAEELSAINTPGLPLSEIFYLEYVTAVEQLDKIEEAEKILNKCLQAYPNSHKALNYLAYMWADNGIKLGQGLKNIKRALELSPENGAYIDTLGWIYYKQKKYDKALVEIKHALKLIDNDPVILEHLGDIFKALNKKEEAVASWSKSLVIYPDSTNVVKKLQAEGVNTDILIEKMTKKPAGHKHQKDKL